MTNIEKIKQARKDLEAAFIVADARVKMHLRVRTLDMDALHLAVNNLAYLQAEALRQATEVADENFARAQKLSEQVQENVRHIERLAERRSDEDLRIVQGIEGAKAIVKSFLDDPAKATRTPLFALDDKLTIALALAKGEAV